MTQIRLQLAPHGQRSEHQICQIQKLSLVPMAKGHMRFAALFDVSMVFNTVMQYMYSTLGCLVSFLKGWKHQFVDINEDVALQK